MRKRDFIDGKVYTPSLFEENASLRRREGLRAWDEEKERRRQELQSGQYTQDQTTHVHRGMDPSQRLPDPFADFRGFAGFEHDVDGEDGDIGRRKSGGSERGTEELMLEAESIPQRSIMLQQPMIASPRGENPFVSNSKSSITAEQQRFLPSFVGKINSAGPMVPPRPPLVRSPPSPPPRVSGGGRREAVTDVPGIIPHLAPNSNGGVEVHVRLPTAMNISSPLPSQ